MILGNECINLEQENIIVLSCNSTSKGNQRKYYDKVEHTYIKEQFNYQGRDWKDYLVEHLSWRLSSMTDTLGVSIIKQNVVSLSNDKMGCSSKDFSLDGSEWISIHRLFGDNLPSHKQFGFSEKIFKELVSLYKDVCDLDITNYLIVMIIFDYLLCNEDRHYNNIGVFYTDGYYKVPPLFDFGLGLFEHDRRYDNISLDKAVSLLECKPFNSNPYRPVEMLVRSGYKNQVAKIAEGLRVPTRILFPSDLAYDYYCYALDNLRRLLR